MNQYLVYDIGGTFIKYALMTETSDILEQGKVPAPTDCMENLLAALSGIADQYAGRFAGAAVSMPGRIGTEKGIAYTGGAFRFIKDAPMGEYLEERLHVPVTIGNDAKCAANAEAWNGALSDVENGAVIVLGTGTGGAVMLNRKIFMGTTGGAGELSHLVVDMYKLSDGHYKELGNRGATFSSHASASGLVGKFAERKGLPASEVDGIKVFAAYDAGDQDAIDALDEFGRITAAGIYSMQSVLDLQKYAIGGGISARKEVTDIIRENVEKIFNDRTSVPFMKPEVVTCHYGNDANLIGALKFHLDREK